MMLTCWQSSEIRKKLLQVMHADSCSLYFMNANRELPV